MKKVVFILSFLLLVQVLFPVFAGNNVWRNFIVEPNEKNYEICKNQIEISLSDQYERDKSPAFLQLMEKGVIRNILKLVENGNIYAGHLCFQLYPLYQGYVQYIQFFNISIGKIIKNDPEIFLRLCDHYINGCNNKYYDLERLSGSYGDEFVDKLDKKLQETDERIKALQEVQNEDLNEIRDKCINYLEERKNRLIKIIKKEKEKI